MIVITQSSLYLQGEEEADMGTDHPLIVCLMGVTVVVPLRREITMEEAVRLHMMTDMEVRMDSGVDLGAEVAGGVEVEEEEVGDYIIPY